MNIDYHQQLRNALIGRRVHPDYMPEKRQMGSLLSFWGREAGMSGGDIHRNWNYRIYLRLEDELVVTDVQVVIEGELLSPCSGYSYEELDAMDYPAVLKWCLDHTCNP